MIKVVNYKNVPFLKQGCFSDSFKIWKQDMMDYFFMRNSDRCPGCNIIWPVLELFNEVFLFLEKQGKIILLEDLRDNDLCIWLAYLADAFGEA